MLALPRQHVMAYQCFCTEHVLHGPRNDRYMPLCMFMSNRLVCLQVAMLTVKSGGASVTWGGTRAWVPRPPWLVAIWLEVTSPL